MFSGRLLVLSWLLVVVAGTWGYYNANNQAWDGPHTAFTVVTLALMALIGLGDAQR